MPIATPINTQHEAASQIPTYISTRELAQRLGVGPRTIAYAVETGLLKPTRISTRRIGFTDAAVAAYLARVNERPVV